MLIVDPVASNRRRVGLFDFDGTLSLIRQGWQSVMVRFMVETLQSAGTGEPPESLRALVEDYVARLTGRQTIYQMLRLCEELSRRGVVPEDPVCYKREYHRRLWEVIESRIDALEGGTASPDDWLLPGSRPILEALSERGLKLYLASGTDLEFVWREARLLDIERYFDGRIYGALDSYEGFSKRMVIQRIFEEDEVAGPELVAFGDGYVEIEETRKAGGIAVGVASNEETRDGFDPWKLKRLREAGAHLLIPHFDGFSEVLQYLGIEGEVP